MTSSVVGLRRSSKALSQSQIWTKKKERSRSLFGGLLPIWSTTAFWIPAKPLHLTSMLGKLMQCTKNCNTCSQHWWIDWAQELFSTMPECTLHNWHFKSWRRKKVEWIGQWSFALSAILTWPLANWLPLLQVSQQLFAGKTLPQAAGGRNTFQEFTESGGVDFHATGINNLFLVGKNVLNVMVSILITKDVFEPSYKDLKFTVRNGNYFCTNRMKILLGGKKVIIGKTITWMN